MKWLRTSRKQPGWLAISLAARGVSYAHCHFAGGQPVVSRFGTTVFEGGSDKLAKELHVERYHCATLLRPGEYQLVALEAPAVAREELKSAIRWRVKDMIDYRIEDAVVDVLDIPQQGDAAGRAHPVYAVAARNETIRSCADTFERARIPLSVIDIPETAQRNLASLGAPEGRGVALLYLQDQSGLLTITFREELCFARRIDIGLSQMASAMHDARADLLARIQLELQRTFDHFDRQFNYVPLAKLLLGPEPEDSGLFDYLKANMDLPVERLEVLEHIRFAGQAPDVVSKWQLFHLFGAALRNETKAS